MPTEAEWILEYSSWSTTALASPLKLSKAGRRGITSGSIVDPSVLHYYWTSTVAVSLAKVNVIVFASSNPAVSDYSFSQGMPVRCIKD